MSTSTYFAEVIESSIDQYTAQCWSWKHFPNFGSLVSVEVLDKTIFGIVSNIKTGSTDPNRTPFPYQKTERELLAEQPQIFEFLKTTFTVQIVGYQHTSPGVGTKRIYYVLPPTPCKIHAFVEESPKSIREDFFKNPSFLHLLFAFTNQITNLDELLLAIIRQLADEKIINKEALDALCQTFILLTGNDYRRLKLFLNRVESIIEFCSSLSLTE